MYRYFGLVRKPLPRRQHVRPRQRITASFILARLEKLNRVLQWLVRLTASRNLEVPSESRKPAELDFGHVPHINFTNGTTVVRCFNCGLERGATTPFPYRDCIPSEIVSSPASEAPVWQVGAKIN